MQNEDSDACGQAGRRNDGTGNGPGACLRIQDNTFATSTKSRNTTMSLELIQSSKLIKQGAEAVRDAIMIIFPCSFSPKSTHSILRQRIYITTLNPSDPPVLLKYRFPKKYRHSSLDASLTKSRVGAEARALVRCLREGIRVPAIRLLDLPNGLLGLEVIDGKSVRQIIPGADDDDEPGGEELVGDENVPEEEEVDSIREFGVTHG